MIEQKFKIGDCVVLKIGGPKMSVTYANKQMSKGDDPLIPKLIFNGYYICQWFDNNEQKNADFHQDELELC
ncbi:MAG: DUF2158 domain-containing protein [Microscillaceae bacterium]|nr:DUF2158 domain-containing protein [Microscillaceae bacterium]